MRHIFQVHREIIPGPAMDFLVLGRTEAQRVAPEAPHIVISISTPAGEEACLPDCEDRVEVLRLQFHDYEVPPDDPAVTMISEEHARAIVEFVQKHRESVRLIVCQCDQGMSRSAAVAAALSRWLQEEDAPFFRYYLPNRFVYDRVLEATGR